ncbi:MAG: hypothetical protein PVH68_02755 [Armatimonadota bacterium]|jgi:hypothetical protein
MLPTIRIGDHDITRLVIGGNPFSGGSHYSPELDRAFIDYYSNENMKRALFECERCGLNTMQSRGDRHIMRMINEYRNEGGTMQWIAQTASELREQPANVRQIAAAGAIGAYHHGTRTDQLWFDGRIDEVQDLLKVMREQGLLVGVGTHLFEVIEYADEHEWDLDFYLACFYRLSDRRRELPLVAGRRHDEHFEDADRERMVRTIQQTRKPCFGFKILAAGRNCGSPEQVREAFQYAFASIKPTDAVIVGMYQEHINQVEMNARLVAEICGEPVTSPAASSP